MAAKDVAQKDRTKILADNLFKAFKKAEANPKKAANVHGLVLEREDIQRHIFALTGDPDVLPNNLPDHDTNNVVYQSLYNYNPVRSDSAFVNPDQLSVIEVMYEPVLTPEVRESVKTTFNERFPQFQQAALGNIRADFKSNVPGQIAFSAVRSQLLNSVKDRVLGKFKGEIKKQLATRLGAQLVGSAALGTATGGIGLAIQAGIAAFNSIKKRLGNFLGRLGVGGLKSFTNWASRNKNELAMVALLAAPGAFVASSLAMVAVGAGAAAFFGGGTAAFVAGGSAVLSLFAAFVIGAIAVTIGPFIVSIIAIPFALALVIFVFTASSYVTAPAPPIVFDLSKPGSGPGVGGIYPSCWPTEGRIVQGPSATHQSFGDAIDIANTTNTPVYATHDGTATAYEYSPEEDSDLWRYGIFVIVKSPYGFSTYYAHLASTTFTGSIQVTAGTQIGYMDDTGDSTGTHLHYELRPKALGINNYVPEYTVGGTTQGCFAATSGGSSIEPSVIPEDCKPLADNARSIAQNLNLVPNPVSDENGIVYSHGVWDYWNHNSQYLGHNPGFWNDTFYRNNISQSAAPGIDDIFWCTALVVKSYESSGIPFYDYYSGASRVGLMAQWFQNHDRFISASSIDAKDVPIGSVIFFGDQHVAMLLSVSGQIVTIAESNSLPAGHHYDDNPQTYPKTFKGPGRDPINSSRVGVVDGKMVNLQGNHAVTGFGLPPQNCQ